ncbi:hypothetical protein [Cecembia sp.]|uniref:hypothetical protein n=1 Tax=Cecembia sp. TaxID=1898110 RepID=UPI0025C540D3|nr:hypothetical protein [Cecembia sp.]
MIKFKRFLTERLHTAENDSKLFRPDDAYAKAMGSMVYKVVNEQGTVVLTTDGIGNSKYIFRKNLVAELRRLAYTKAKSHDYAISTPHDYSKDKRWTFLINNKAVAHGSPKDLIAFLMSGPIREDVEDDDAKQEDDENKEREDKPKSFLIIDKESERVHSRHRSRADVDKVLGDMSGEDRKQYKIKLEEAAYKGNIGIEELYHFYIKASPAQKQKLEIDIKLKKFREAWALVQQVTNVKLAGF